MDLRERQYLFLMEREFGWRKPEYEKSEIDALVDQLTAPAVTTDGYRGDLIFIYTHHDYLHRSDLEKWVLEELRSRGVTVIIKLVSDKKPIPNPWPLAQVLKPANWQDPVTFERSK